MAKKIEVLEAQVERLLRRTDHLAQMREQDKIQNDVRFNTVDLKLIDKVNR